MKSLLKTKNNNLITKESNDLYPQSVSFNCCQCKDEFNIDLKNNNQFTLEEITTVIEFFVYYFEDEINNDFNRDYIFCKDCLIYNYYFEDEEELENVFYLERLLPGGKFFSNKNDFSINELSNYELALNISINKNWQHSII